MINRNKKKSQSAIEFVILVGAVFFFFIIFLLAVQFNISDKTKEKINLVINDIALGVQNEINLAAESSDGYYREFKVSEKVIRWDYDINVTEGSIYARTVDGKYAVSYFTVDVNGDVQKGTNVIRKELGKVCLNIPQDLCLSCGNFVFEPEFGEVCDSNPNPNDCTTGEGYDGTEPCLSDCSGYGSCVSEEYCGDGILQDPPEQCDSDKICTTGEGYSGTEFCLSDCSGYGSCVSEEYCGDGLVNGNEQCDDGCLNGIEGVCEEIIDDGDGCDFECRITTACNDQIDNDGDGKCDFKPPFGVNIFCKEPGILIGDPDCISYQDDSEGSAI